MEDPWHYRIRGEFEGIYHLNTFEFGFHRLRSHSVLAVRECPIHHQRIEAGINAFRQAVNELAVKGIKHLLLTAEPAGPGLLWELRTERRGGAVREELGARVAELLPEVVLLDDSMDLEFWTSTSGSAATPSCRPTTARCRSSTGRRWTCSLSHRASGCSTSTRGSEPSAWRPRARPGRDGGGREPRAISLGRLAARINGIGNVEFLTGRVETVLRKVRLGEHEAVLADPPRAGFEQAAVAELMRLGPARIAYVSCEPSTQARDVALLIRAGYRVRRAAIVDMFPQTYHIESVVLLERAA